jgi:hypothetical protein
MTKNLGKNVQVFAVKTLLAEIQFCEFVLFDVSYGQLTTMYTNSINIMFIDELRQVF